jgi:hypothetical protein
LYNGWDLAKIKEDFMVKIILPIIGAIVMVSMWVEIYLTEKKKRYLVMIFITILGELAWFYSQGFFGKIFKLYSEEGDGSSASVFTQKGSRKTAPLLLMLEGGGRLGSSDRLRLGR